MFLFILDLFKDCFSFVYTSLDRIKLVGETSVLDFLLVFFVVGIFLPLFIRQFGGRAISVSGASTFDSIRRSEAEVARQQDIAKREAERNKERANREAERKNREEERKSYAYYKERRSRSEEYSSRYQREKEGR